MTTGFRVYPYGGDAADTVIHVAWDADAGTITIEEGSRTHRTSVLYECDKGDWRLPLLLRAMPRDARWQDLVTADALRWAAFLLDRADPLDDGLLHRIVAWQHAVGSAEVGYVVDCIAADAADLDPECWT